MSELLAKRKVLNKKAWNHVFRSIPFRYCSKGADLLEISFSTLLFL